MAGNFVPPTQSSTLGKSDNRWAAGFFDKLAVKTLEVIGGGTENDAQPATVGWVKRQFQKLMKTALEATGMQIEARSSSGGYICFGTLFGGLIVQWGEASWNGHEAYTDIVYPVTFKKSIAVIPIDVSYGNRPTKELVSTFTIDGDNTDNKKFRLYSFTDVGAFRYFAIGF